MSEAVHTFSLRFYEAENPFYVGEAVSVTVPSTDGEYSVMAQHYRMVMAITTGLLKFRTADDTVHYASVSNGIMRVENFLVALVLFILTAVTAFLYALLILVDSAEDPDEIDVKRAREEEEIAREQMLQKKSLRDYYLAEAALQRAMSRLKISRRGQMH